MSKKKEGQGQGQGQEQAQGQELRSFRAGVDRAVYAGVLEANNWQANKVVSAKEFEQAVAKFLAS